MSTPAAPATPTRSRGTLAPKPAAPTKHAGTDDVALGELRNAAATYDFFRGKGDPAQFWEMLRLARGRRAIVVPPGGEAVPPTADAEASIVHELALIRRLYGSMVRDLRRVLKNAPGLPEPSDRLEMALAFLLASTREHQAVTRWVAEPAKNEGKAAEKLRSLAAITDPYREALQPWVLQGEAIEDVAPARPEPRLSAPAPAEGPPPVRAASPAIDARQVEIVQQAIQCREKLAAAHLDSELWEALLLVAMESSPTSNPAQADGEALERLHEGVSDLREMYAEWVRMLRTYVTARRLAPQDPRAFEVGVGLMLALSPAAQDRLGAWLEDPASWLEEASGLLGPWMRHAVDSLAAA